jgi:hypothetical protein
MDKHGKPTLGNIIFAKTSNALGYKYSIVYQSIIPVIISINKLFVYIVKDNLKRSEYLKEKISDFVKFVKNELDLEKCPVIILQNGRGELKTTASYNHSKEPKVVRINVKNRALVDVLRSIAHEMVHHKQYEQGKLKVQPPDIGGEIEDEANAKAGQFIKMFSKKDNTIYDE